MTSAVLHWMPLGSGASVVRRSGAVYEAVAAGLGHRLRLDIYHSASLLDAYRRVLPKARRHLQDDHGSPRSETVLVWCRPR